MAAGPRKSSKSLPAYLGRLRGCPACAMWSARGATFAIRAQAVLSKRCGRLCPTTAWHQRPTWWLLLATLTVGWALMQTRTCRWVLVRSILPQASPLAGSNCRRHTAGCMAQAPAYCCGSFTLYQEIFNVTRVWLFPALQLSQDQMLQRCNDTLEDQRSMMQQLKSIAEVSLPAHRCCALCRDAVRQVQNRRVLSSTLSIILFAPMHWCSWLHHSREHCPMHPCRSLNCR